MSALTHVILAKQGGENYPDGLVMLHTTQIHYTRSEVYSLINQLLYIAGRMRRENDHPINRGLDSSNSSASYSPR